MILHCKSCGFKHPKEDSCLLHKRGINPEVDSCSWHAKNPPKCSVCGHITMKPIFEERGINLLTLCSRCAETITTCGGCKDSSICRFQTDPSPIPLVVQKQIRQGPMTQIVQVKNPDRINITCKMGCHCWDKEGEFCHKEDGWCERYDDAYYVEPVVEKTEEIADEA